MVVVDETPPQDNPDVYPRWLRESRIAIPHTPRVQDARAVVNFYQKAELDDLPVLG